MSKVHQAAVVEAMEQRVLFDASQLTETIALGTLPASVSDKAPIHGTVVVTVTNNSGTTQKGRFEVEALASTGPLDLLGYSYATLKVAFPTLSLTNGQSKEFTFPILIAKGGLADGQYNLYAAVTDPTEAHSQSGPEGTLTVRPPIIVLSETESFSKFPKSVVASHPFNVVDTIAITNSGSDPSADPLSIKVFATPDGNISDGTLLTPVAVKRAVTIPATKTVKVQVLLPKFAAVAAGTYKLITQVTQSNGTVTTTDPTLAPTVTVEA